MGLDTTVDEAELSEREVDLADEDEQQVRGWVVIG